jgi:hypothetical protein
MTNTGTAAQTEIDFRDREFSFTGQVSEVTDLYRVNGRIVRAVVHRDSYERQSYATASVLTEGGWAPLVSISADRFQARVNNGPRKLVEQQLVGFADELISRAHMVLMD